MLKNLHLNQRLSVESLLISNDLDGNLTLSFVVCCPNHLAKGTFANDLENFIAVSYVISGNYKKQEKNIIQVSNWCITSRQYFYKHF